MARYLLSKLCKKLPTLCAEVITLSETGWIIFSPNAGVFGQNKGCEINIFFVRMRRFC